MFIGRNVWIKSFFLLLVWVCFSKWEGVLVRVVEEDGFLIWGVILIYILGIIFGVIRFLLCIE